MARAKRKTRSAAGRAAARKGASRKGTSRKKVAARSSAARKSAARGAKRTTRVASDRQNRWSAQEDRQLRTMVRQGYPIRDIVAELGRTESAVRQHVYKRGLKLRGRKRRYRSGGSQRYGGGRGASNGLSLAAREQPSSRMRCSSCFARFFHSSARLLRFRYPPVDPRACRVRHHLLRVPRLDFVLEAGDDVIRPVSERA